MKDKSIEKEKLRSKYLQVRKELPNKTEKSQIINTKIINTKEYKNARIIALYKSLPSEVNIDNLIEYSLEHNKVVALPKVIGDDLFFYTINSNEKLLKSNFGILEPVPNPNNLVDKKQIDLIIVPGICFDLAKNRLGFGKGFYDRYLNNLNVYKIGLCFHSQVLTEKNIPTESFDIKMDKVITEKNEY